MFHRRASINQKRAKGGLPRGSSRGALARAALSWIVVLALLHATFIPFAYAAQANLRLAELESIRVALGVSVEEFSGFLCHEDESQPVKPAEQGKACCVICLCQGRHLSYGLPPEIGANAPLLRTQPAFLSFALATIPPSHLVLSGHPRAPPAKTLLTARA